MSVLSPEPARALGPRPSRFLDVAGEAFAVHRYCWTRMDDVAAGCGVSKPHLYKLFGSKAGIYEAVVRRLDDAVRTALAESPTTAGLEVLLGVLAHRRHLWTVVFDPTAPFVPGDGSAVTASREHLAGLARLPLPAAGVPRPRSRRDELLDRAVHHGAGRALVDWWATHPEESARSVLDRVARIYPHQHARAEQDSQG